MTIGLLVVSNVFMTFAWYGHLRIAKTEWGSSLGLVATIFLSWFIALFEYFCMIPANKIGYVGNDGPFSLVQLKVIQEVMSLTIFTIFTLVFFKTETFRINHLIAFVFLILAVYFMFKK